MRKRYTGQDVYTATQDRLRFLFDAFDNVLVSFSGGKDSGLLLNLALDFKRRNGIKNKIGVFHQDFEAQYARTTEFVARMFRDNLPDIDPYWVCLPTACKTTVSGQALYWYPWDEAKRAAWVRPMPEEAYVIHTGNNPFDLYRHKMPQEELYRQFNRWYAARRGGKTVVLLGLRSDESLHRYSAIVNKVHGFEGKKWLTAMHGDVYSASPLYDWSVRDVWTANGKYGYDYNRLYDLFYQAGVPIDKMRVASPFNEWAAASLNLYRTLEPDTWARLVGRISGANFAALYGGTEAMGYRAAALPEGRTWREYTAFLLSTLPDTLRAQYTERFEAALRLAGLAADEAAWKALGRCILKNDRLCRSLSLGALQGRAERKKALVDKYKNL